MGHSCFTSVDAGRRSVWLQLQPAALCSQQPAGAPRGPQHNCCGAPALNLVVCLPAECQFLQHSLQAAAHTLCVEPAEFYLC